MIEEPPWLDLAERFYYSDEQEEQNKIRQKLLQKGREALPAILNMVWLARGVGRKLTLPFDRLVRLASLVADFQEPGTLLLLLSLTRIDHPQRKILEKPFLDLCQVLEERATDEDVLGLIEALRAIRKMTIIDPHAVTLARALVRIAERNPDSEFREVLPLLRYRLTALLEFMELHKRLKVALGKDNLPIPAMAKQATQYLPIPTKENPSTE